MTTHTFTKNPVLGDYVGPQPSGMRPDFQRETVARLTTYCERLIRSGELPAGKELELRTFVNLTCNAFDMAPVQDEFEKTVNTIREVMESSK